MSNPIAQYTFIPWYRSGLSTQISTVENGRGVISADVYYKTDQSSNHVLGAHKSITLLGPGDVESINPQAIIKTEPRNGLTDFEANYLAHIEFYDEDFPWRYSPEISPSSSNKLLPWVFLLVLKEDEFVFEPINSAKPLQAIQITGAVPLSIPLEEAWAWAHVQVNKQLQVGAEDHEALRRELAELLSADPDAAFSRLICPRKLELNTQYHAFLIPLYESGRKAGLGEDPGVAGLAKAWVATDLTCKCPYYFHWEFGTSAQGDFETLARRLQPMSADELVTPTINIQSLSLDFQTELGSSAEPTKTLTFIAAYKAPGQSIPGWPDTLNPADTALKEALRNRINENATDENCDPIVNTPPMYGRWHAALGSLQTAAPAINSWIHTLNLDPKYRAVAGLGTEIIRKNQEKFMDIAWDQLGEVLEANQKLRQAQFAIEVNKKMLNKHIESLSSEDIVAITRPVHNRLKTGDITIAAEVASTALTASGTNAGLRKVLRRNGKSTQKLNNLIGADKRINHAQVMTRLNFKEISGAPAKPNPYALAMEGVPVVVNSGVQVQGNTYVSSEEVNLLNSLHQYDTNIPAGLSGNAGMFTTVKDTILSQIHPLKSLGERMMRIIPIPEIPAYAGTTVSRIQPVMAAPKFVEPMYEYLALLSKDFIIPGISGLKNNSVLLMEPNQAFIEAFMTGLNHEMARELLWREYPTDQRGTYFKQFWNPDDFLNLDNQIVDLEDIRPLDQWTGNLGTNKPAMSLMPAIVLVIRGDLLRKFPNTIIFAQKAKYDPYPSRKLEPDDPSNVRFPLFKAQIDPDITLLGFDITPAQARGNHSDAGYFFMFKERLGETRFGLDVLEPDPDTGVYDLDLNTWDDLSWRHLNPVDPDMVRFIHLNAGLGFSPAQSPDSSILYGNGGNAAHMAYILYQMPVLLGIAASGLLPPTGIPPLDDNAVFSSYHRIK